jgi:hypothetical protein
VLPPHRGWRRRLKEETAYWRRFSEAIGFALEAVPEDL